MNPVNDLVITTSIDGTSRLWDTSKRTCICKIQDSQCANFDPSGKFLVSVISENSELSKIKINYVNFYSIDNNLNNPLTIGPYKVLKILDMNSIIQARFSPDGLNLIFKDSDNITVVYDIFTWRGLILNTSRVKEPEKKLSKSPLNTAENFYRFEMIPMKNSPYLFNSSSDGITQIWNYTKGYVVNLLHYHENDEKIKIRFNSDSGILVTGSNELVLWKI